MAVYRLTKADAGVVMAMTARGDTEQDIAAWFGVNQGRVAEVRNGEMYGPVQATKNVELPPSGPIGRKARRMRASIRYALEHLKNGEVDQATARIEQAAAIFDKNE